ncbi:uncharacterized protein [Aristolochia californica]|uniref:uncharacterized protein isoform X2 n=1 Tax=Aristolochia californica TaxID=171875 RepID=UPI0035DBF24E
MWPRPAKPRPWRYSPSKLSEANWASTGVGSQSPTTFPREHEKRRSVCYKEETSDVEFSEGRSELESSVPASICDLDLQREVRGRKKLKTTPRQIDMSVGRVGKDDFQDTEVPSVGASNKDTCLKDKGSRVLWNGDDETSGGTSICQHSHTHVAELVDNKGNAKQVVVPYSLQCSNAGGKDHSKRNLQTFGDHVEQLPFAKTQSLWKTLESMEVFNKLPTCPHFRPLDCLIKESREGLAIGKMVTFASLIENLRKSKFDDPVSSFEDRLKVLVDLESHGFDVKLVRVHLLQMIKLKKIQDESETHVALLGLKILEQEQESKRLCTHICNIDRKIEVLDRRIALLHERRPSIGKQMENCKIGIAKLEKEMQAMKEKCFFVKQDFDSVVVRPLLDQSENLPTEPKSGSCSIIDLSSDGEELAERKTIAKRPSISSPNIPLYSGMAHKKCSGKPTLENYAGRGKLDQDDKLVVEEFLKRVDQDCKIVWASEDNHITRADVLNLLKTEHVLSDPVISCFSNLLKQRVWHKNMVLLKCQYVSPWVHVKISRKEYDKVESCLVKLTTETLAESQLVFIPLCSECHWHLLVIDLSKKSFNAYDSLPNRKHKSYTTKIANFFRDYLRMRHGFSDAHEWPLHFILNCPKQANGYDCGVFVILYMDCLSHNIPLGFVHKVDIPSYRGKVAAKLLRQEMY